LILILGRFGREIHTRYGKLFKIFGCLDTIVVASKIMVAYISETSLLINHTTNTAGITDNLKFNIISLRISHLLM